MKVQLVADDGEVFQSWFVPGKDKPGGMTEERLRGKVLGCCHNLSLYPTEEGYDAEFGLHPERFEKIEKPNKFP